MFDKYVIKSGDSLYSIANEYNCGKLTRYQQYVL